MKFKILFTTFGFLLLTSCISINMQITPDQAIEKIRTQFAYNISDLYTEHESDSTKNGRDYFVIHAYYMNLPSGAQFGMSNTIGWYYVDIKSGETFLAYAADDESLLPQDNIINIQFDYNQDKLIVENIIKNDLPDDKNNLYYNKTQQWKNKPYYFAVQFDNEKQSNNYYMINAETQELYTWDIARDSLIKSK